MSNFQGCHHVGVYGHVFLSVGVNYHTCNLGGIGMGIDVTKDGNWEWELTVGMGIGMGVTKDGTGMVKMRWHIAHVCTYICRHLLVPL